MRRIVTWALSTITTLVLLFSYHTSTSSSSSVGTVQAAGVAAGSSVGTAGTASPTGGSSGTATSGAAAGSRTYAGTAVSTRFGNVQVQITVSGGKVTAASVLQIPHSDMRDQQINGYAVPILNREAVAAQSSDIDMVSGATITSRAYLQSLQSALDQAGL